MSASRQIAQADDGIRLDRWFKRHCPGLSHALLEKYLRKGQVRLDGRKVAANERLQTGQTLSYPEMPEAPAGERPSVSEAESAAIRGMVIYRDEQVIALNKEAGLAVQGGSKIRRSVDGMLDALRFDAAERPRLVHRLDKDTSGVLLLARSARAAGALAGCFAGKTAEKTYLALVVGGLPKAEGVIDLPLGKAAPEDGGRELVGVDEHGGKDARTEYRVLETLGRKFALVELRPLTGRMHQLRVHMQAAGCPIAGDGKYGGAAHDAQALGISRQLHLHAGRLVMPAVAGGKKLDIRAKLPPHFRQSLMTLGLQAPR